MPDDNAGAGSATDSASQDAQPQGQGTAGNAAAADDQGSGGDRNATPEIDDRRAEELLAEMGTAADGGKDPGGEDPLKAAQAEAARWREQARKQEKRAKENAEKAKNFDAYTESQKTEQQRLADRAAEAERRAAEAEGRFHRTLAAATYDLPPSMIDQLGDGTEDQINERAETLAAEINKRVEAGVNAALAQAQAGGGQQPRNGAGFRPVESLRAGALPASDNKPQDANAWLRNALTKKQ